MAELDAKLEQIIGTDVDLVSVRSLDPARDERHRRILADACLV